MTLTLLRAVLTHPFTALFTVDLLSCLRYVTRVVAWIPHIVAETRKQGLSCTVAISYHLYHIFNCKKIKLTLLPV